MIPPVRYSRPARDPQWLTLEVCREFVRNKCARSEEECKYAHPPPQVEVQNSKVICCFDSLLGRCHRVEPPCKYFHPPQHLKDQLSQARRSSLLSQIGTQQQQSSLFNLPSIITAGVLPMQNSLVLHNNPPYNHGGSGGNGGSDDNYRQLLDSLLPPLNNNNNNNWLSSIRPPRSDRLEVCREFQRGVCTRQMSDCKFAHPSPGVALDPDNHVTVCMDYLKERCSREMCKYFHPPLHLQTRSIPSSSTPNLLQQQLIQQQLYQQQQHQQQQQLMQQLQQQRSSLTGSGLASSSMVAWPILQNVQPIYQQSSLILSLLSLHQQQQQQQQLQHQLQQQQMQQQPINQSLQQQMILNSSLTGVPPNASFRPPQ